MPISKNDTTTIAIIGSSSNEAAIKKTLWKGLSEAKYGVEVLSGLEPGVQTWAAQAARYLSCEQEVTLTALLPCQPNCTPSSWTKAQIDERLELIQDCNEVVEVTQVTFNNPKWPTLRALWIEALVERATVLLAVWDGKSGGLVKRTVLAAREAGITVTLIDPDTGDHEHNKSGPVTTTNKKETGVQQSLNFDPAPVTNSQISETKPEVPVDLKPEVEGKVESPVTPIEEESPVNVWLAIQKIREMEKGVEGPITKEMLNQRLRVSQKRDDATTKGLIERDLRIRGVGKHGIHIARLEIEPVTIQPGLMHVSRKLSKNLRWEHPEDAAALVMGDELRLRGPKPKTPNLMASGPAVVWDLKRRATDSTSRLRLVGEQRFDVEINDRDGAVSRHNLNQEGIDCMDAEGGDIRRVSPLKNQRPYMDLNSHVHELQMSEDKDLVYAIQRKEDAISNDLTRHLLNAMRKLPDGQQLRTDAVEGIWEEHPRYDFTSQLEDIDPSDHYYMSNTGTEVMGTAIVDGEEVEKVIGTIVKSVAFPKSRWVDQLAMDARRQGGDYSKTPLTSTPLGDAQGDRLDIFVSDGEGDLDSKVWDKPRIKTAEEGEIVVAVGVRHLDAVDEIGTKGRISQTHREILGQEHILQSNPGSGKLSIREDHYLSGRNGMELELPGYMRIRSIMSFLDVGKFEAILVRRAAMEAGMTYLLKEANREDYWLQEVTRDGDRQMIVGTDMEELVSRMSDSELPKSYLRHQRLTNPLGIFGVSEGLFQWAEQIANEKDGTASWLEVHAPWTIDNPGAIVSGMSSSVEALVQETDDSSESAFDSDMAEKLESLGIAVPESIQIEQEGVVEDEEIDRYGLNADNDMILNRISDPLDGFVNEYRIIDPKGKDVDEWAATYEPRERTEVLTVTFRGKKMTHQQVNDLPLEETTLKGLYALEAEVKESRKTALRDVNLDAFYTTNRKDAKRNITMGRIYFPTPMHRAVAHEAYAMWDANYRLQPVVRRGDIVTSLGSLSFVEGGLRVEWVKGLQQPEAFAHEALRIVRNCPDSPVISKDGKVWTITSKDDEPTPTKVVVARREYPSLGAGVVLTKEESAKLASKLAKANGHVKPADLLIGRNDFDRPIEKGKTVRIGKKSDFVSR